MIVVETNEYLDIDVVSEDLGISENILLDLANNGRIVSHDGMISRNSYFLLRCFLNRIRDDWCDEEEAKELIGLKMLQTLTAASKITTRNYLGMIFYERSGLVAQSSEPKKTHEKALLTIKEAAMLLGIGVQTMWKWAIVDKSFEIVRIKGRKSRAYLVKRSSLQEWLDKPFFRQRRFSFVQLNGQFHVSRQTIRHWILDGKIQATISPGGQRYILADQLPICEELALESRKYNHSRTTKTT